MAKITFVIDSTLSKQALIDLICEAHNYAATVPAPFPEPIASDRIEARRPGGKAAKTSKIKTPKVKAPSKEAFASLIFTELISNHVQNIHQKVEMKKAAAKDFKFNIEVK